MIRRFVPLGVGAYALFVAGMLIYFVCTNTLNRTYEGLPSWVMILGLIGLGLYMIILAFKHRKPSVQ